METIGAYNLFGERVRSVASGTVQLCVK